MSVKTTGYARRSGPIFSRSQEQEWERPRELARAEWQGAVPMDVLAMDAAMIDGSGPGALRQRRWRYLAHLGFLVSALVLLASAHPAFAQHHGGERSGGHGGGWHGRGGGGGGWGLGLGLGLGLGWGIATLVEPYPYGYYPYPYGYSVYPAYDYPYGAYAEPYAPQPYVPQSYAPLPEARQYAPGRATVPVGNWYYCDSARGYYPYVAHCPEAWRPVPAVPAGPTR